MGERTAPSIADAKEEHAASELHELQAQCAAARAALELACAELALAQQRLETHPATLLREANEQLVVSALEAQQKVEMRERELGSAVRTLGLDPLTQLPNRLLLRDRFEQAAAAARRHGGRMAVLFVDLDRFKRINDLRGHAAGDKVLRAAAHALVSAVRESDTVSRHGGDEFVVLLSHLVEPSDAATIAEKISSVLAHTRVAPDEALHLSASIGTAIYPEDGEDIDTLIDRADAAMYRSKRGPQRQLWRRPRDPAESAAALPDNPTQLREVNERLVIAVLSARDSQQAAESAVSRQETNLAVTAHELRNPLAPIAYALELLKTVEAREPLVARVRGILERQVAQMTRLVGDLLDVSRAATGKLRIERGVVEVDTVVDAAVQAVLPAMQRRAQTMQMQLPAEPLRVNGDPVRLVQVLSNLLDNASKYTPDGGSIHLGVAGDAREVVLTVSDSGIGISPAALPHVFDAFVQEAHAATVDAEGLGIGLMLVQQLVQAHGGRIVAHSRGRDRGSEFVVTLPRATAAQG